MVKMKRFYLMLCFLMSIIGSAWGQETATKTFTLDVSEMGKDAVGKILTNGYSNEYISMSFSECQKYDYSIKINGWSDKVPLPFLTVTPNGNNVTITKVVLKGALDNNGNDQGKTIKVGDITLTAGKDEDNYSRTYEPTEGVSEPVVFVKEGGVSYMQSIEVTYTKTLTPTDNTIDVVDLNYVYNTNANRGFDRLGIQGFDITFAGGDGVKCYTDNGNQILIRNKKKDAESTGDQGQMIIALHDAAGENNGKY